MDLPKEPNPQPIPQPTGAVTAPMQKWISVIIMGCIMFFAVIGWAISRWSGPSKGVMEPRLEKKHDTGQKSAYQLNEEREKAYEQGKLEASQGWWNQIRASSYQPPPISQVAQLTPKQQARQEYEKLLHDAAMTDNMVEGRKKDDLNTAVGGLPPPPAPAVAIHGPALPDGTNHVQADTTKPIRLLAANILPEGTEIACTLVNQLSGDNTGPVKVQVSNDIPFPRTDEIAIPQGSLFLGEAQKVSAQFQQRLAVSFHLLQLGATAGHIRQISLDKFPGLDQQGSAALTDQVNNHYASIFGASLAVGAIGGLSQIGSGSYGGYGGIDTGTQVRNGISQSTAQSSSQILNRFLNRLPTVRIRAGHTVVVALTANLEIPQ